MLEPRKKYKNKRKREPELVNQLDPTPLSRSLCISPPNSSSWGRPGLTDPALPPQNLLAGEQEPPCPSQGHEGVSCCRPGTLGWVQALSGRGSLVWY